MESKQSTRKYRNIVVKEKQFCYIPSLWRLNRSKCFDSWLIKYTNRAINLVFDVVGRFAFPSLVTQLGDSGYFLNIPRRKPDCQAPDALCFGEFLKMDHSRI